MTDDSEGTDPLDFQALDPRSDTAAFDALINAIVKDAQVGLTGVHSFDRPPGRTNLNAIGNRGRLATLGVAVAAVAAALFLTLSGPARGSGTPVNVDFLLADASGLPASLFRVARTGEHPTVLEWLRLYPAILAAQPIPTSPPRQP